MNEEKCVGSAEIAFYNHRNKDRVRIQGYNEVNRPIKTESAEVTKRIVHKVFKVYESEKGGPDGSVFYTKDVRPEQTDKDGSNGSYSSSGENSYNPEGKKDDIPAWGKVVKNFVDQIAADNRTQWVCIVLVAIIAALGIAIALR